MLSQLTKTIKMALKSTEEERAILRARSAVQRFPVVEWRQRIEDFHRRSIVTSRGIAGMNAWRESDCDGGGLQPMPDTDDWDPVSQTYPSQPEWDSPRFSASPGTPGQWSQEALTPGSDPHLQAPRFLHDSQRNSLDSTDGSDYFSSRVGTTDTQQGYGHFLDKANRTIARDQRHAQDPFLDSNAALIPNRPFGAHSRVSSVESIASIVDEKSNSPLNKAIASVSIPVFTR
jgi:alpha-1,3-glucan synthase